MEQAKEVLKTPKQLFSPTSPPFKSPIFIYYTSNLAIIYIYFYKISYV